MLLQSLGRIHVSAFSDASLHSELTERALFWQQPSFYGVDITPLHMSALEGYFKQVRGWAACLCWKGQWGRFAGGLMGVMMVILMMVVVAHKRYSAQCAIVGGLAAVI